MTVRDATVCYPIDGREVLLIRKKRGLGAGRYNGPGGKVEDGESPRAASRREVAEEVGLTVRDQRKLGEVAFVVGAEPVHLIHVFRTESFSGTPEETPEAAPEWFHVGEMPYDRMWEDDREWLPLLLDGTGFRARYVFDDADQLRYGALDTGIEF